MDNNSQKLDELALSIKNIDEKNSKKLDEVVLSINNMNDKYNIYLPFAVFMFIFVSITFFMTSIILGRLNKNR